MIGTIIPSVLLALLVAFMFIRFPKPSLMVFTFITGIASLFILAGVKSGDIYDIYANAMRGYVADSLMAETIKGKTFGFASHIDVKRDYYLESRRSYSYNGAYTLFGKHIEFLGSVDITCASPEIHCMKADSFTHKVE